MKQFIQNLPKAELHLHIEGTLEPELMFRLAKKNHVLIPYKSIEEVKQAYHFISLQSFLDIYYKGAAVLVEASDFYDLTMGYLKKCHEQNIVHTEIFFDPQTHTDRGIAFETVVTGISEALEEAKRRYNISSFLIMSFLRHLSQEAAFETLEASLPFRDKIKGVGLDSSELGNPPSKFKEVFQKAKEVGYELVAHAGEEGDSSYIWEAIELLDVSRIDHGIRCDEDEKLVAYLQKTQLPLTVCPLSNVKLKAIKEMKHHNILKLLHRGLLVMVNSDDPAYFGGYLNENLEAVAVSLQAAKEEITQIVENSFKASFLGENIKQEYLQILRS